VAAIILGKYANDLSQRVYVLEDSVVALQVTVTAYSAEVRQTDSTPNETAFLTKVRPWTIAVSRDLLKLGWKPGSCVWLDQIGLFEINDLMNVRFKNRIDVFFHDRKIAKAFGIKRNVHAVRVPDCGT
jgi:3D (Asp-Asp-Asp) domain-containing protein